MDYTKRQITKIAREVNKFTVRMLKTEGVGSAEYDFIHVVRKNPLEKFSILIRELQLAVLPT